MLTVDELKKRQVVTREKSDALFKAHTEAVGALIDELGDFLDEAAAGCIGVGSPAIDGARCTFTIAGEDLALVTGRNCYARCIGGPLAAKSFIYQGDALDATPWFEIETIRSEDGTAGFRYSITAFIGEKARPVSGGLPANVKGGRKGGKFFIDFMYSTFENAWHPRPRRGAFEGGGEGKRIGFAGE